MNDKHYCERAVLGSMLIETEVARSAVRFLKREHFFNHKHQMIFKILADTLIKNNAVDLILAVQEAKDCGHLAEIGGELYLSELMGAVSNTAHWRYYAAQVKRAYHENRQYKAAEKFKQDGDTIALLQTVKTELREIDSIDADKRLSLTDVAYAAIREIERRDTQIKTGYDFIDKNTPVERGDLVVIPGRPASGKSLLNINIAKRMLEGDDKTKILFFTTEMTPPHFFKRQISLHTEVPYFLIKTRKFDLEQIGKINRFVGEFIKKYENRLIYSDISRPSIGDIAAELERVNPDAVFIDNLSGVKLPGAYKNKTDNIGSFVWELKDLLIENKCVGFLTCHLSRAAEKGRTAADEPILSDIKDSSSLEEAGTHVILLWSKRNEGAEMLNEPKEIRWRIAKDRDGFGGTGALMLNRKTLSITE